MYGVNRRRCAEHTVLALRNTSYNYVQDIITNRRISAFIQNSFWEKHHIH